MVPAAAQRQLLPSLSPIAPSAAEPHAHLFEVDATFEAAHCGASITVAIGILFTFEQFYSLAINYRVCQISCLSNQPREKRHEKLHRVDAEAP